eukprot:s6880_g1.t1
MMNTASPTLINVRFHLTAASVAVALRFWAPGFERWLRSWLQLWHRRAGYTYHGVPWDVGLMSLPRIGSSRKRIIMKRQEALSFAAFVYTVCTGTSGAEKEEAGLTRLRARLCVSRPPASGRRKRRRRNRGWIMPGYTPEQIQALQAQYAQHYEAQALQAAHYSWFTGQVIPSQAAISAASHSCGTSSAKQPQAPATKPPAPLDKEFTGQVRSISAKDGYGFIICEETKSLYGRDVFVEPKLGEGVARGIEMQSKVAFTIELSEKGHPRATSVKLVGWKLHTPGFERAFEIRAKGLGAKCVVKQREFEYGIYSRAVPPYAARGAAGAAVGAGMGILGVAGYVVSAVHGSRRRGYTDEFVQFFTEDGISLTGWFIPQSSAGRPSRRILVFCHPYNNSKSNLLGVARGLWDRRYSIFMFDFRSFADAKVPSGRN